MENVRNLPGQLNEIFIGQIIFDHSEWVSLWGYVANGNHREKMDFILSFDLLNKLLRFSGQEGDRIQMLLVEKLEAGLEEPTIVDLEHTFGKPICLNQCRLEVGVTGIAEKNGAWKEDPACLSIEEVIPLIDKRSIQPSQHLLCRQNLDLCHEVLANLYKAYLGYLELGFEEEIALKKAELTDDLKFKMAYYAWDLAQTKED